MNTSKTLKTCTSGKIQYQSLKKARLSIHKIHQTDDVKLRAYYCPECGKYHLTSHNSPKRLRMKYGKINNRAKENTLWKSEIQYNIVMKRQEWFDEYAF